MAAMKFDKSKKYEYFDGEFFTCYYRANGQSYEVGIYANGKQFFFGNFINKAEAYAWYKEMNAKMVYFMGHYEYMPNMKSNWYFNFAKNYFYNAYYAFLNRAFSKYNTEYKKAFSTDMKMYKKFETSYAYSA